MPEIDQILADEDFKNKAAAVVAGVLVIVAGFLVYNYFSKVGEEGELPEQAAIEEQEGLEEVGRLADEILGETDETSEEESAEGEVESVKEDTAASWQATNYTQGDIAGENYAVKKGDTLWEIAEARYGSGFEWGRILEANKDSIGFLPNGSQALIAPGQVLVLPQ